MIFQDKVGDTDAEPSYSCDAEVDNESMGLFIHEREEPSNLETSSSLL